MSFILGGHKRIHPTQEGLLLKKFENHWPSEPNWETILKAQETFAGVLSWLAD